MKKVLKPFAIGLIRVSTGKQCNNGASLEVQAKRIKSWADSNNYKLLNIHSDKGISGAKTDNRPGFQKALKEACEKQAALVVYSLSRLGRSTKDIITTSEELEKAGADLVSLTEQIDTSSAAGKMVFKMLAVLGEFERDLISERTKASLQHMKTQGKRTGNIPYGKQLSEDKKFLEDNPEELQNIQLIR